MTITFGVCWVIGVVLSYMLCRYWMIVQFGKMESFEHLGIVILLILGWPGIVAIVVLLICSEWGQMARDNDDGAAVRVAVGFHAQEIDRLRAAIRKHRDYRGDDRCWMDDEDLYRVLPEGYTPPVRDSAVELKHCERFIACRHNPGTEYISPEREIERLREKMATARKSLELIGAASLFGSNRRTPSLADVWAILREDNP